MMPRIIQKSVLSTDGLVQGILRHYKLQGPVVCDFWNQGLNDSYIVRSKRGKHVLRVYRAGWRTRREILSELDLLNYLHRQKVPVSRPIRRGDGRYLQGVEAPEGRRYAALFSFAPGKVAIDSRKAYRYGALAATIHASTDRQSKRHPRFHLDLKHLLEDPLAGMAVQLQHRRHDLDYLHGVATGLAAKIRELLPTTTPEYGVCHGDLHHGNVHFGDDDEMTIFVLRLLGVRLAYDISVFYWNYCHEVGEKKAKAVWSAYRKGYREVRPYSRAELAAVNYFVPIRHIWLVGLHAGLSQDYGRGWMQDGYFDRQIKFVREWVDQHCPDVAAGL